MENNKEKYALCMITNDAYSDGVCVDIVSFLKHNPWFDGDIVIIDYGFISDKAREKMSAMYDKVIFKVADDPRYLEVYERVKKLQEKTKISIYAFPYLYKIEAFGLEGYDRVVFFDSDLVVFDDVRYLFENPYDLAVCMDDGPKTNVYGKEERWRNPGDLINSGVMSIRKPSRELFDEVMNIALNLEEGPIYKALCYEQDSICTFFDKHWVRILPCTYNFPQIKFIYDNILLTDQKIVHYYGPFKPWKHDEPRAEYVNGFYNGTLEEVEERYHLKTRRSQVPLVFHLYLSDCTEIYSPSAIIHKRILQKYHDRFCNPLFVVSVDDPSDTNTLTNAMKWISECGFGEGTTVKVVRNDEVREAKTFFTEIIDKMKSYDTPVFFAHNKGSTHGLYTNVSKWTIFSYFSILRDFETRVWETENFGLASGYVPVAGAKQPWDYDTLNKYGWHAPGTILLLNPKRINEYLNYARLEVPYLKDYLSAELFLGNLFDIKNPPKDTDRYNIFFEGMRNTYFNTDFFNPYEVPHSELIRYFLPEDIAQQYDEFYNEMTKTE